MNDCRIELLDVSAFSEIEVMLLVSTVNKKLSENDIRLEFESPNIKFSLVQLDMMKYKAILDELTIDADLKSQAFAIIDDIGSYGLKGKKRRFVGYNAERKVANRKEKEQDRGKHYYANDNGLSVQIVWNCYASSQTTASISSSLHPLTISVLHMIRIMILQTGMHITKCCLVFSPSVFAY